MKTHPKKLILKAHLYLLFFGLSFFGYSQNPTSWTTEDLMQTEELVQKIEQNDMDDIELIHIGFESMIQDAIDAGSANDPENLNNLKKLLREVPKDKTIVLYCGCCPMDVCPNINPAYEYVADLGFKHVKLLNLETSIKADWLDKGFPTK